MRRLIESGTVVFEVEQREPTRLDFSLRLLVDEKQVRFSLLSWEETPRVPALRGANAIMKKMMTAVREVGGEEFAARVLLLLDQLSTAKGPNAIGSLPGDLPLRIRSIDDGEAVPAGYVIEKTVTNPFDGSTLHLVKRSKK
jgi:hypothetical protein